LLSPPVMLFLIGIFMVPVALPMAALLVFLWKLIIG
jgi:hypothetical protein